MVISLSIVATETSTLTLIGVPALAYTTYARPEQGGSLTYLQVVAGYRRRALRDRVAVHPRLLQRRDADGVRAAATAASAPRAKHFAASLFLVMRALAEGVRVFAASLVLAAVLGASVPGLPHLWLWSIALVGVLTLVYTFEGGIAAVIWTDLIQLVIYVAGSLLAAWMLVRLVPGGWTAIVADASRAGKLQVISWSLDPTVPFTFWAGLIGGCFLTMASHGTDQLLVQRLLTCRNRRESQKAIVLSGIVVFAQFALFLWIGADAARLLCRAPAAADGDDRRDLPGVHRPQPAARRRGPGDRRDLRRGDVEPQRVAELAGVDDGARFLPAADPPPSRRPAGC